MTLASYDVSIAGSEWPPLSVNATSRGKAKSEADLHFKDAGWEVPFTALRARKVGGPVTSDMVRHVAELRGMPGVRCGDRVRVGEARGAIVGAGSGANFEVLFDEDSPRYAGQRLFVHPAEMTFEGGVYEQQ